MTRIFTPLIVHCQRCGARIRANHKGRANLAQRKYCSHACSGAAAADRQRKRFGAEGK